MRARRRRGKPVPATPKWWRCIQSPCCMRPRKIALRSFGQYLQGVIYAAAEKWSDADVQLRASLPGIQRPQSKAEALYYLGLANYRLAEKGQAERAPDALLFSRQSADIPSSCQQMARKNAEAIRTKFQIQ